MTKRKREFRGRQYGAKGLAIRPRSTCPLCKKQFAMSKRHDDRTLTIVKCPHCGYSFCKR